MRYESDWIFIPIVSQLSYDFINNLSFLCWLEISLLSYRKFPYTCASVSGFLFYFIDPFVYSYASITLFLLLWLCNMSVSGKRDLPSLFFFKIAIATCVLAILCTFLESICHIPLKIVLEILTEKYMKCICNF